MSYFEKEFYSVTDFFYSANEDFLLIVSTLLVGGYWGATTAVKLGLDKMLPWSLFIGEIGDDMSLANELLPV